MVANQVPSGPEWFGTNNTEARAAWEAERNWELMVARRADGPWRGRLLSEYLAERDLDE